LKIKEVVGCLNVKKNSIQKILASLGLNNQGWLQPYILRMAFEKPGLIDPAWEKLYIQLSEWEVNPNVT
jgi:hypothetical protein